MQDNQVPFAWQKNQWQQLQAQVEGGHLPHALLFVGEEGLGKVLFAQAFAQGLLCENAKGGVACQLCKSCQLLAAQTHPDYYELAGSGKSQAINVDAIRELVDFCEQTPQCGNKKIILIFHAEKMNINASNALLKMLEEPSGNTYFILTSHAPVALSATIRSRCQTIRFLNSGEKIPGYHAAPDWQADFFKDCTELLSGKLPALAMVQKWQKEDALTILDQLYIFFSNDIRKHPNSNLFFSLDHILKARKNLLQHNSINPQLQLESLLIACTSL